MFNWAGRNAGPFILIIMRETGYYFVKLNKVWTIGQYNNTILGSFWKIFDGDGDIFGDKDFDEIGNKIYLPK